MLVSGELSAQEALVLSGGGSRGLAHVGVVAGVDSLGHDPDLVIGVSMGAVVGSLYAAGYTSHEIWRIAADQDWRDLFKPMPLVIGTDRTIALPTLHWAVQLGRFEFSRGFLSDWRINRQLVAYLFDAQARTRGNFDRLPRKFRTLAAKRTDGTPVIIESGDLARAVRASMAEPGVFSPVYWNDEVLIDGGIADYMPVGLAKSFGVKTVIASDVTVSELEGSPNNPLELVQRALTLLIIRARQDTATPTYLVVPELDPHQSGFIYPDDVEPLITVGLNAALHSVPHATSFSRQKRSAPSPPDSLRRLIIETPDSSLALLARAVFHSSAPARYLRDNVIEAVDRLYASGFTESVWPRVDSSDALIVRVDPRPNGSLDTGLGYDNDRSGRAWASVQRRFSQLGAPSEVDLSGAVTGTERWASFTARRSSLLMAPMTWAASATLRKTEARFVRLPTGNATVKVKRLGGLIGAERRHVFPDRIMTASFHVENIESDGRDELSYGPMLKFGVPEPDRVVGVPLSIVAEQRFGEWNYGRAAFRGSVDRDLGRLEFAAVADAAITNADAPADVLPSLGDDRAMPGMRWGEERGRARMIGGFDVAYPLVLGGHIRLRARAGAAPLRLDDFDSSQTWVVGTEIGALWSLPVGSILIAGGFNGRGKSRFDVIIGQVF
jgi:predicted acylesterase/phospholipase RssA